jgi:basic membrane protein A and related proteins
MVINAKRSLDLMKERKAVSNTISAILVVLIIVGAGAGYYFGVSAAPAGTTITSVSIQTVGKTLPTVKIVYMNDGDNTSTYNQVESFGLWKAAQAFNGSTANIKLAYAWNTAPANIGSVVASYAAQGFNVMVTSDGPAYGDLTSIASKYPNILFYGSDIAPTAPNLANTVDRFYDGYYLEGILAGAMTKTNVLGFITAYDYPSTATYYNAFRLGAQTMNPKAKVLWTFTQDWHDSQKGATAASGMITQGADVIIGFGDGLTDGSISAAASNHAYTFGIFVDESHLGPSYVLTSLLWNPYWYHLAVLSAYFAHNAGGRTWNFGVDNGLETFAPFNSVIPASVIQNVTSIQQQMIAGTFTVPLISTFPTS